MANSSFLLLVASIVTSGACVLSPNWGDEPTRRSPIDFDGMASKPDAVLRIQAWNHDLNGFDTVSTFLGTSTKYASSPDLYRWSRIGLRLPDRYWIGSGGGCTDTGMANLRVQERNSDGSWSDLATFDQGGEECIGEHMADGDHPVAAGNACKRTDPRIVLFAPPQCVIARTSDATPPEAVIRLTDSVSAVSATKAYERTSGTGATDLTISGLRRTSELGAYAFIRDRDGAVRNVQLRGSTDVVCRRSSDGSTMIVPVPVSLASSQTITAGAFAQISLEASQSVHVPRLSTETCPAGWTFLEVRGALFATGVNAAGLAATSPTLRFTIR